MGATASRVWICPFVVVAIVCSAVTPFVIRSASVEAVGEALVPLEPARLLETRTGPTDTTIDGLFEGDGRTPAATTIELTVAGRGGVPTDATAAFLNVTAVFPDGPGYLTIHPCGTTRPHASNLNYLAGQVIANSALARIGTDGKVCIYTHATTDIVTDVNGYVPLNGTPEPLEPARLLETRTGPTDTTIDGLFEGDGRTPAATTIELTVAGRGGVPTDATAAFLNVTAVFPDGPGYLTIHPCGTTRPHASNLNYLAGQVIANSALAKIGTDGKVCIYTHATTDIVTDVNGYVPLNGTPEPLEPARLLETRTGPTDTTIDGLFEGDGRTPAATTIELTVAGRGGVPTDATAAFLNVTAVFPDGPGYLTIHPCGTTRPHASNLNYLAGQVIANSALAKIGTDGKVCIYTHATTDIVTDVNGYVPADTPPPTTTATTTTTTTTTVPADPCGGATTVLSSDECAALDTLYASTNGPGWADNTGWDTDTDPCTWHGVTCNATSVSALILDANNLVGTIPVEIGDLAGLVALNLGFNGLTGPIPTQLGNLTDLTSLSLHGNGLTGPIPTQLGNLTDVAYLSLFDNQLTGSIPSGLGNMTKLYVLYLYDNQLDGTIPTQLGDATKLQTLWISGNQLTGPIPTQLGNLTELITLRLYGNSLDGAIPTQFGNLTELVRLELYQNQLTGAIPDEIGLLTKMQSLRLHDNQLAGDLTTPMSALRTAGTVSTLFLLGNDCLSTTDPTLATWLSGFDTNWSDGCP